MEQVLDAVWDAYSGFTMWSPSRVTTVTLLAFTACSSFVLTGFTAGSRMFTLPLCFILLFVAGLFANYLGRDLHLAGATEMQTAIVFAVAGQMIVAFLLLLLLKTGSSGQRRG